MSKNTELYSSEEVKSNNTLQLPKPAFNKPNFAIPEIKKITTKSAPDGIDITKVMEEKEINAIPAITVSVKNLKNFYDGLMKSINKYNGDISEAITNGVVTPLSSTIENIGTKTNEIDAKLEIFKLDLMIYQRLEKLLHYSILLVKRTDCFNKKGNSLISGCCFLSHTISI